MEPPSCDLKGAQSPTLQIFLEIRAYKNHYYVAKGDFRLKAVEKRYFIRYRVLKLRCLLDETIIFLYKYVELTSKFSVKIHARKEPPKLSMEPPSYRFTSTPLTVTYPKGYCKVRLVLSTPTYHTSIAFNSKTGYKLAHSV